MPTLRASHPVVRTVRVGVAAALPLLFAACKDGVTEPPYTPAHEVTVVSGAEQKVQVGTALTQPVVLQVVDQTTKQPAAGVAVELYVPYGNGSLGGSTTVTSDANGQVSVSWTLGTVAKPDTLIASIPSESGVEGAVVEEIAAPATAAQVVVVAGDNQSGSAGATLAPITVKVLDAFGNVVPGAVVQFSDDDGGTFANSSVTTDASGLASVQLTLTGNPGVDDVTISVSGADGTATATVHETETQ